MTAPITFHLIFHTHWDREWYLPEAAFAARLVPVVGDLLATLSDQPDARFMLDGQTILLEDVLAIAPGWHADIRAAVGAGQLDIGPWYVLADEQIPSGESLVRNLLMGRRTAAAFGNGMPVLYSPDAFGHPALLPTLASEFGLRGIVLWRGLNVGAADGDIHEWAGPDGSVALVYQLPAQGYEFGADLLGAPEAVTARWRLLRPQLVARSTTRHVAVFVGADHHAAAAEPTALRDALQEIERDAHVRISSLGDFIAALQDTEHAVPQRRGELREYGHTWTLQGVHGTRARLKRRHSALELMLQRRTEPLVALAAHHDGAGTHELLDQATRLLLKSQFHDTLGGCASDVVARAQGVRLDAVQVLTDELRRNATHAIAGHDPNIARDGSHDAGALIAWNPAARRRSGVATATITVFRSDVLVGPPGDRTPAVGAGHVPASLRGPDGALIPLQVLSRTAGLERVDSSRHYPDQDAVEVVQVAFDVEQLRGLDMRVFAPSADSAPFAPSDLVVTPRRLANRHVELHLGDDGRIDLYDRRSGERFTNICQLVDDMDNGDTYTPWIRPSVVPDIVSVTGTTVLADGPLVGVVSRRIRLTRSGVAPVDATMAFCLQRDSPLVRIRLEFDNRRTDHRLRLCCPVGNGVAATAGSAFHHEWREPVDKRRDVPMESQVLTAPAHRYVAAGSGDRGLAMFFPGFAEYEWSATHDLAVTLCRSVGELSRGDLPTRPGHAGWPTATPDAQEPGMHRMELAIAALPFAELSSPETMNACWEDAFLPFDCQWHRAFTGEAPRDAGIGFELDGDGLTFTACKAGDAERDAIVLRCVNATGATVRGCWTSARPLTRALRCRADETFVHTIDLTDAYTIAFDATVGALVTIMVWLD